jgi:hypothetical protein
VVARRYAFPTDAVTVRKSEGLDAITPFGETFDADTVMPSRSGGYHCLSVLASTTGVSAPGK